MPLQRRIPKFGFKNINRVEYNTINVDDIQYLVDNKKIKKDLTLDKMIELRMVKKGDLVKVLGRGKLDVPVNITAHKFSASAEKIIEKAGGKVTLMLPWLERKLDQERVYGVDNTFETREEQEQYVRAWLKDSADMKQASEELCIEWYPARHEEIENSIYSMGDITALIPSEDADICILEEPEHLNW